MSSIVNQDFASLYPQSMTPVSPMSKPTGMLYYMDFNNSLYSMQSRFENINNAIKVKIKDTFDNFIEFIERPDIILGQITNFVNDLKFPGSSKYEKEFEPYLNLMHMKYQEYIEMINKVGVFPSVFGEQEDIKQSGYKYRIKHEIELPFTKCSLIEVDAILEVPYTAFTEEFGLNNNHTSGWLSYTGKRNFGDLVPITKELNNGVTCSRFVELLYTDLDKKKEEN